MALTGDRTLLLTGATGFLGPYVAAALAQEGWHVRAALRQPTGDIPSATWAEAAIVGPIGPTTDWTTALTGAEAVVHLAARAHRPPAVQRAERDAYMVVNAAGTLHLAREAAAAGARHFVFMSSIAVNGSTTDGRAPFRETDEPAPRTVYGETKVAAEAGLRALAAQSEMAVTAIRPPMIYGRQAKGSFRALVRAVATGLPLPFAAVRNRRAFVAAENVASFIAFRLATSARRFEPFIVADDEHVSTANFVRLVAQALGRRALLFPIPMPLLRAALRTAQMQDLIDSTLGSLELDTSKARAAGWQPSIKLAEGLARATA